MKMKVTKVNIGGKRMANVNGTDVAAYAKRVENLDFKKDIFEYKYEDMPIDVIVGALKSLTYDDFIDEGKTGIFEKVLNAALRGFDKDRPEEFLERKYFNIRAPYTALKLCYNRNHLPVITTAGTDVPSSFLNPLFENFSRVRKRYSGHSELSGEYSMFRDAFYDMLGNVFGKPQLLIASLWPLAESVILPKKSFIEPKLPMDPVKVPDLKFSLDYENYCMFYDYSERLRKNKGKANDYESIFKEVVKMESESVKDTKNDKLHRYSTSVNSVLTLVLDIFRKGEFLVDLYSNLGAVDSNGKVKDFSPFRDLYLVCWNHLVKDYDDIDRRANTVLGKKLSVIFNDSLVLINLTSIEKVNFLKKYFGGDLFNEIMRNYSKEKGADIGKI